MKFAVLADIHANLEALQSVLADAEKQRCTHYAIAGDLVGYCADPTTCLNIVRAMSASCVKGNHDEYSATECSLDGLTPRAAKGVEWTRSGLTQDERQWLRGLPYVCMVEDFTFVHATLHAPERWEYVFDHLAAASSIKCQKTQVCFFGHTHVPVAFVNDGSVRGRTYTKVKLEPGKKYFINPGSVGQPRDNNPEAAYVIYDVDNGTIELRRLAYDTALTQSKIRDAGLGR